MEPIAAILSIFTIFPRAHDAQDSEAQLRLD